MDYISIADSSAEYELLDSGGGRKLERFGEVVISRPDPQALWTKSLPESDWKKAWAAFEQTEGRGKWRHSKPFPETWQISYVSLTFVLKPSVFKHIGLFPEQSVHWKWMSDKIKVRVASGENVSVLNLFGYTGGLSLACALAGAEVCHVDASQFAVDSAVLNRDVSGLEKAPVRFIVEDVRKFVEREIRRGNTYDVICMDPPVYGKGAKDEVWKLEEDLVPFLSKIKKLLSDKPLALLVNGYSSLYSHMTYANMLHDITHDLNGSISSGELGLKQTTSERILPSGIFARWESTL